MFPQKAGLSARLVVLMLLACSCSEHTSQTGTAALSASAGGGGTAQVGTGTLGVTPGPSLLSMTSPNCPVPTPSHVTPAMSLALSSNQQGTFSTPAVNGPFRLEMRIHNWSTAFETGGSPLLMSAGNAFYSTFYENVTPDLYFFDNSDSFVNGQGTGVMVDIANRPDFIVRIQRDVVNMQLTGEIWNVDGSNYALTSIPIDALGSSTFLPAGSSGVLGGGASVDLAYMRWNSTVLPLGSPPPIAIQPADLLDWEFERSLVDQSASGNALALSNALFVNTPVYAPACNTGGQQTFRAQGTGTLNATASFSLAGDNQLSYCWSQLNGPTSLGADNPAQAIPTISGFNFGTYNFQLTVTDSLGQSSSCTVEDGAVFTDATDHVQIGDPNVATLIGPQLRWGASPWPWFDNRNQAMADFFGGLQSTTYLPYWKQADPNGTISLATNSPTVTGTGTRFLTDFCNAQGVPNGNGIVLWYVNSAGGFNGYRTMPVSGCASDTQLTIGQSYYFGNNIVNQKYAIETQGDEGTWINGSTNVNYYDNVLAFYSLYYRSGIVDYLNYARNLADLWWQMPYIDQGSTCDGISGFWCPAPRLRSMTGLFLRTLDGRPDMWPQMRVLIDSCRSETRQTGSIQDIRENSYSMAFSAMCALLDPDTTHASACQTDVANAITTRWAPQEQAGGNWVNPTFQYASWNGNPGSVTVTQGSNIVTGVGTQWTTSMQNGSNFFWVSVSPYDNMDGDPTSYFPTILSATSIQLDRPYEGMSGSNRGWQIDNLVGVGTQPFMMGIVGHSMAFAYQATGLPQAKQFIHDSTTWLINSGYRADTKGLWYGRIFPNCEPISVNNGNCSGGDQDASRFLSGEVMGAFAQSYLSTGDPTVAQYGDTLMGAMYGYWPGPDTDGGYLAEIASGGWDFTTEKAKDFGFLFGFGGSAQWQAVRPVSP